MLALNINGSINAGKSTVSKILVDKIPNSIFIELDDLLSDEEQEKLELDFKEGIALRLERFDDVLKEHIKKQNVDVIIFAYPISEKNHKRWMKITHQNAELKSVTLAPNINTCLTNRGSRDLNDWERNRIKEMYKQGYQTPSNTDLIIDNSNQTPDETAMAIINFIKTKEI